MQLSDFTTMRVGGPARLLVAPATEQELLDTVRDVWASGEPWLALGGGSNVVIGDEGFDGTVIRIVTRGIEVIPNGDTMHLRVQAGEPWDDLVAFTVAQGWAGIEALSGIPGSTGAAPIQNIGAYGQEIASTLVSIDFFDYLAGELVRIPASELALDYRTSAIKQGREGVVVAVELELVSGEGSVAYPQLATALGVELGTRVPLGEVRQHVLALRASKGMVLDPADPDSVGCGSFFTNPIVSENFARGLPDAAPRWPVSPEPAPVAVPLGSEPAPVPYDDGRVKLSAAWLIEQAGIQRGFALPGSRAAISSKHTLAITNRGGATAEQVAELARFVQACVVAQFGVLLHPEPVTVGLTI
ncbi:UDP-N-acetylmuramate dehydrogenase [soil metagenome]